MHGRHRLQDERRAPSAPGPVRLRQALRSAGAFAPAAARGRMVQAEQKNGDRPPFPQYGRGRPYQRSWLADRCRGVPHAAGTCRVPGPAHGLLRRRTLFHQTCGPVSCRSPEHLRGGLFCGRLCGHHDGQRDRTLEGCARAGLAACRSCGRRIVFRCPGHRLDRGVRGPQSR